MQAISKLPEGEFIIGIRQIVKASKAKKLSKIIAASNCPDFLIERIPESIEILRFEGDQKELGTKLGKPFSIALVGYK